MTPTAKNVRITSFTYRCDVLGLWAQWKVFSPDISGEKDGMLQTDSLYLTPHDSWEKLEEDLDKCFSSNNSCYYLSKSGECCDCILAPNEVGRTCDAAIFSSIKERICKLRKKDNS